MCSFVIIIFFLINVIVIKSVTGKSPVSIFYMTASQMYNKPHSGLLCEIFPVYYYA